MPNKISSKISSRTSGKAARRKKAVLGRGLGSLLGARPDATEPTPPDAREPDTTEALEARDLEGAKTSSRRPTSSSQPDIDNTPPLPKAHKLTGAKKSTPLNTPPPSTQIEPSLSKNIDFQEPRVWQIGTEKLEPRSEQPRKDFDPEALRQLADSIAQQGILQPIIARKKGEKFEIVAGERRWRAAALAGLSQVPVILRNEASDQKLSELALIENIQREDLNPIEEAEAYQYLMQNYGLDHITIAKKVGKQRATVSNILRLLKLVPELREAMVKGQLLTGQAKVLLSVDEPELQLKLGRQVIQRSLTVAQSTRLVKQASRPSQKGADFAQIEARLSDELQKTLGTKVSVRYDKGKASVWLRFYSDEELNDFIEKVREAWND